MCLTFYSDPSSSRVSCVKLEWKLIRREAHFVEQVDDIEHHIFRQRVAKTPFQFSQVSRGHRTLAG